MPRPEVIKTKLMQLPILTRYEGPYLEMPDRETKVWEKNEKGAHFHFYGKNDQWLWDPKTGDSIPSIGYMLSITGSDQSKQAILKDFVEVLGEPRHNLRQEMRQAFKKKRSRPDRVIAYYTWLQPEDENAKNDPSLAVLAENSIEAYFLDLVPKDDDPNQPTRIRPLLSE